MKVPSPGGIAGITTAIQPGHDHPPAGHHEGAGRALAVMSVGHRLDSSSQVLLLANGLGFAEELRASLPSRFTIMAHHRGRLPPRSAQAKRGRDGKFVTPGAASLHRSPGVHTTGLVRAMGPGGSAQHLGSGDRTVPVAEAGHQLRHQSTDNPCTAVPMATWRGRNWPRVGQPVRGDHAGERGGGYAGRPPTCRHGWPKW